VKVVFPTFCYLVPNLLVVVVLSKLPFQWLLDERDEDGSSLIAIHPSFDKLLTALRTAVANEYKLDKQETSYDNILDAFRLSLIFYKRAKE
jgi:hypothetical protein